MGPAGQPGDVSVIFTRTSPSTISTSYTRPRSMMFMSSSGSLTCRSALRAASALSATGAVITTPLHPVSEPSAVPARLPPEHSRMPHRPPAGTALADARAPHQAVPSPRNPGVHPPRDGPHARDSEAPGQPALPRQPLQELRDRVRAGEHPAVGGRQHEMHRRRQSRKRDLERRHAGAILERDQRDAMFPVPALEPVDRAPAEAALAIVYERRASAVSAHRTPAPPRRRRRRARVSGA